MALMTVSELKLLLTKIPDSAQVKIAAAGTLHTVGKATLSFPSGDFEIDPSKSLQEALAPLVQVVLQAEPPVADKVRV
jgi:hypothetical protein